MTMRDVISKLYRQRDWAALHGALDAYSPDCDAEGRCCIAHWRSAALAAENRCLEAVEFLTAHGYLEAKANTNHDPNGRPDTTTSNKK